MWDCQEDRERIFQECQYQVVAIDMLAAALPALERADLDMDFLDALAKSSFNAIWLFSTLKRLGIDNGL